MLILLCMALMAGCGEEQKKPNPFNNKEVEEHVLDLEDIQNGGELIVLTLYGANSYFDFHGEDFGYQFRLIEDFAEKIGTTIRVEVLNDEKELVRTFLSGEGDVIAYNLSIADSLKYKLTYCGEKEITYFLDSISKLKTSKQQPASQHQAWAVRTETPLLADAVSEYLAENQSDFARISRQVKDTSNRFFGGGGRARSGRVYVPRINALTTVMDASKGIISPYDDLFRSCSMICNWDWRLLAAQAYQESGFDSQAVSRAGARGIMQIMPKTARGHGMNPQDLFTPSVCIKGAAGIINSLNSHFSDIADRNERINFVLASYNGGAGHIDDARRLASKHGLNPDVWEGNVEDMVLALRNPEGYRDPEVKYGFMRGDETYRYVRSIRNLWNYYRNMNF